MKRLISFFFIAFFAVSIQAQEEEKAWSVSLDQGIYDKYVWRGLQYNNEGVNQGAIDLSYDMGDLGTFGANVWYNLDLDNETHDPSDGANSDAGSGQFSEVDYTFYWEKSFDSLTLGAGHIYYDFSEVNRGSTREIYVSASYDMILAPSVTVYYDYEDVDGIYVDFAIGHSFELAESISIDLGANLGYADDQMAKFYYNTNEAGFSNYSLSAAVNFGICENVTVTPSIMYYGLLEDADDQDNDDDDIVVGVNLNVSF